MKAKINVVSTPTSDTPGTCLFLEFDDKKYILGRIHEGCQRAILERGKRMIKVTDVFMTGTVEWANTGGLMGLLITCADSKTTAAQASRQLHDHKQTRRLATLQLARDQAQPQSAKRARIQQELDDELRRQEEHKAERTAASQQPRFMGIHGGRNLKHTVATCRRFVFRRGMPLRVYETEAGTVPEPEKPTWSDSNINVFAIPTLPTGVSDKASMSEVQRQMLTTIVNDMFDSNWSMDALFETRLAEVQMPAAIFTRDPTTNKLEKYRGPRPGDSLTEPLPDINVLVRRPWPAATISQLPPTTPSPVSMSYIVQCHSQRGKFLPNEAKKLRVPQREYKVLTAGESVTLEDGTVITPDQVLEPSRPGAAFAVIDIPSPEYIDSTLQRSEWNWPTLTNSLRAIFWILGPKVANDPRIASFVDKNSSVEHIISSADHTPNYLSLASAADLEVRLASIDDEHHPLPEFDTSPIALPAALQKCRVAHPGRSFSLEPKPEWSDHDELQHLNCAKVLEEVPPAVRSLALTARKTVQTDEFKAQLAMQQLPGADAEIITLGTGSAAPSKHRNTSATLLRVPGYGSYLFDAGENTMGQLSRMFKPSELDSILKDLRMIWISHLHADHHLGTTSVIRAWTKANHGIGKDQSGLPKAPDFGDLEQKPEQHLNRSKLFVASDDKMISWLMEYSAAEDFGLSHVVPIATRGAEAGNPASTTLRWQNLQLGFNTADQSINTAMRESTGLVDIQTAFVDHCAGAQAISITFADGFKVSYSGDCRPSKRFVEIGKGSTVLIHEATFNDELQGDALAKKHSTISEAIKVGMEMGAPRIVLTHFSQRYAKVTSTSDIENYQVNFQEATGDDADAEAIEEIPETADAEAQEDGTEKRPHALRASKSSASLRSIGKASSKNGGHASSHDLKVGVAFDYMRVKVRDIAVLEKFHASINALLEDEGSDEAQDADNDEAPKQKKKGEGQKKRKRNEAQNGGGN